jgi:MFS transporter, FLVCR family, MFS-domain-containing protein 7
MLNEEPIVETSPLQLNAAYNSSSGSNNSSNNDLNPTFKLYTKRWLVLLSFALLNMSNGWTWMTWSPLTALVAEAWSVTEGQIDAFSGIHMYVFVPTSFVSMWLVVNHLGLSRGLRVGAALNCLGDAIRYAAGGGCTTSYPLVYLGTFVCALAQTFILPALPLLSGSWFGAHERASATSLGVLGYQTGMGLGLGATILVDFQTTDTFTLKADTLASYLQLQWMVSLVALIMVVSFVTTDRPPTPPSAAAEGQDQSANATGEAVSYKESVNLIVDSPSSRWFFLVFGLSVGVFYAIPTFLSQFVPHWSPQDRGWLGGIFQTMAIVGCSAAGTIVDKFHQQYQRITLLLLGGAITSVFGFTVAVWQDSHWAMVACGGTSFFLAAFMAVGIEFGTALTYPADEGAVYGVLDCTAELTGFLLVTIGGAMTVGWTYYLGILLGFMLTSGSILYSIRGESKRPKF